MRVGRVVLQQRLVEEGVQAVAVDVRDDDVLALGQLDLAGAVLVGEFGEFVDVVDTHPADEDVQTDVVVAVGLFVDAHVVAVFVTAGVVRVVLAHVLARGGKLEVHELVLEDLAHLLGAPLVDEELDAGVESVVAVAVLAEERGHAGADVCRLLRRHPDVERAREARLLAGKAAADAGC